MYKANGYYPIIRCVCGHTLTLKRATVCQCGVTIRAGGVKSRRNSWRLYGVAPDAYNEKAQPHRMIVSIGWTNERTA